MKQTLEEAARSEREKIILELHDDYSIHKDPEHYIISSGVIQKYAVPIFKAGAEWQAKQSPWIRAKDQLPPVDEKDISEQSEPVLVKISGHCEPEILIYNKYYHVWDTSDGDDYSCNISDDDLWMPIPSFDEILEANRDVLERIKEKGD